MPVNDPNRAQLLKVAQAMGDLRDEVVFVGGATVGLLITDPVAPSVRPTMDVDVVVELASFADYHVRLVPALRAAGFSECTAEGAPICAWKVAGIRVDFMPTTGAVLGFTNPWYKGVVATAQEYDLDGSRIRLVTAPYFVATKLAAFDDRGGSDFYGSHDLEDILAVVDGRPAIADEVAVADPEVRDYLGQAVADLLDKDDFHNALPGHIERGRDTVVLARLRRIAGGAPP